VFSIVVAMDRARGIGQAGKLPWQLPGDMAYFKRITSEAPAAQRNAVVMGRKTYESLPEKFRPLPKRLNVVLTREPRAPFPSEVMQTNSFSDALGQLADRRDVAHTFVIGGGQIYEMALAHEACTRLYITEIDATFACDTFFPSFDASFRLVTRDGPHHDKGVGYAFAIYERL
jgi:dihydrofolate reductase